MCEKGVLKFKSKSQLDKKESGDVRQEEKEKADQENQEPQESQDSDGEVQQGGNE